MDSLSSNVIWSEEAEQAALGAYLIDEDTHWELNHLTKEDFYSHKNQIIFDIILKVRASGLTPDLVTVREALVRAGLSQDIGDMDYLSYIASAIPSTSNLHSYIKIIKAKSKARRILQAAKGIIEGVYNGKPEVEIDKLITTLYRINAETEKALETIYSKGADIVDSIGIAEKGAKPKGLMVGYPKTDANLGGIMPQELMIMAARPSMGKSAVALDWALRIARNGEPVLFLSLEMSKEQLTHRILSSMTGIDSFALRRGVVTEAQLELLTAATMNLVNIPIIIDDSSAAVTDIIKIAHTAYRKHGIKAVFIDYIQLVTPSKRYNSFREGMIEVSRSIKTDLAVALNVPVIALCQVSRSVEDRKDKMPMLSDLKESGAFEQDADIVVLNRPSYWDENDRPDTLEMEIRKHRNGGKIGGIDFWYDFTRFDFKEK